MTNQFLNAQVYSNVMLLLLKNALVMGHLVDGQFKNEVSDENGLTTNIKRPPRFLDKKDGTAALATQDILTGSVPVAVNQYSKVHIGVGDIEYVQSYNSLMQNATMKSAASTLAHSIDSFLAGQLLYFPSWISGGKSGTRAGQNAVTGTAAIGSPAEAMSFHTRLMNQGTPNDGQISGVMEWSDNESIRGTMLTQYLDGNMTALERAKVPMVSEIDWYSTQQLKTYTSGTRTQGNGSSAGAQVNGANQNVNYRDVKGSAGAAQMTSNLILKAFTAAQTIPANEVFTIQGVYAWDWRNQQALPYLQQFRTTTTVTADGTGAATLVVSPPIIVQGTNDGTSTDANTAFGFCDSIPADSAYIEFVGAASTKLQPRAAFHKRGIALVSTRLAMPFTGTASFAVDPVTGIAVRYWRGSDISTGQHIHRWDCMYGATVPDPMLGTRGTGYE